MTIDTIPYNEKALRKAVREVVAEYKKAMMGRYSIVDAGGRKWKMEFNILIWKDALSDWDYYDACNTQRDIFKTITKIGSDKTVKLAVGIELHCEHQVNRESILTIDGKKWEKGNNL